MMFGYPPNTIAWAVTYVKNGIKYYLSEVIADSSKYVWTTKKDKAKRYGTQPAAEDMAETVRKTHKKKVEITVTQV